MKQLAVRALVRYLGLRYLGWGLYGLAFVQLVQLPAIAHSSMPKTSAFPTAESAVDFARGYLCFYSGGFFPAQPAACSRSQ